MRCASRESRTCLAQRVFVNVCRDAVVVVGLHREWRAADGLRSECSGPAVFSWVCAMWQRKTPPGGGPRGLVEIGLVSWRVCRPRRKGCSHVSFQNMCCTIIGRLDSADLVKFTQGHPQRLETQLGRSCLFLQRCPNHGIRHLSAGSGGKGLGAKQFLRSHCFRARPTA